MIINILSGALHYMHAHPYLSIFYLAVYIVYKCQHFIFREHTEEVEEIAEYKTQQEAEYRIGKHIAGNYDSPVQKETKWSLGEEVVLFTVRTAIAIVVFIVLPFPKKKE